MRIREVLATKGPFLKLVQFFTFPLEIAEKIVVHDVNVQHLDVPSRIRIAFLHVVFLIINDWKTPIITCLILLLRKNEATLCCDRRQPSARFRTLTELFFCSIEITNAYDQVLHLRAHVSVSLAGYRVSQRRNF